MILWSPIATRRVTGVHYHDFEQAEYQDGLDEVNLAWGILNLQGCCEFASDYIPLVELNQFSELTKVRRFRSFIHVLIDPLYNLQEVLDINIDY